MHNAYAKKNALCIMHGEKKCICISKGGNAFFDVFWGWPEFFWGASGPHRWKNICGVDAVPRVLFKNTIVGGILYFFPLKNSFSIFHVYYALCKKHEKMHYAKNTKKCICKKKCIMHNAWAHMMNKLIHDSNWPRLHDFDILH